MKLFVRIAGIECQNCIDALTRALNEVNGVVSVRFHGHVAELEIAQPADGSPGGLAPSDVTERIVAAVRDEGYETRPEWISTTRPWCGAIITFAIAAALVAAWCGLRALLGFDPLSLAPSPDGAGRSVRC